ncbi:MAG: translation elongation factor-like protein [Minisyncoccia bacterium]|jgi:putative protease
MAAKGSSKEPKPIGEVVHFYNKIGVAIVKFNKVVPAGTKLAFKGATTDFEEVAGSMQYDHKAIDKAPKGEQVGIKVSEKVHEGDSVYLAE